MVSSPSSWSLIYGWPLAIGHWGEKRARVGGERSREFVTIVGTESIGWLAAVPPHDPLEGSRAFDPAKGRDILNSPDTGHGMVQGTVTFHGIGGVSPQARHVDVEALSHGISRPPLPNQFGVCPPASGLAFIPGGVAAFQVHLAPIEALDFRGPKPRKPCDHQERENLEVRTCPFPANRVAWQCRRLGAVCGCHLRALQHPGQLCRAWSDSDTDDAGAR